MQIGYRMGLAQKIISFVEQGIFIGYVTIGNGGHNGNMPSAGLLAHLLDNGVGAVGGQSHAQNDGRNTVLVAGEQLQSSFGCSYIKDFVIIAKVLAN